MAERNMGKNISDQSIPKPAAANPAPPEGMCKVSKARVNSLAPDVKLTPRGSSMMPTPYNTWAKADEQNLFSPNVFFNGYQAMTLRSNIVTTHGGEAGTGGGMVSGTYQGKTVPITSSKIVRINGSPAIRHGDLFSHNEGNTIAEAQFIKDQKPRDPPKENQNDKPKGT